MVGIPILERNCGADTPFQPPESQVPRHGPKVATRGLRVEDPRGGPVHMIPNWILSIGEPVTRNLTIHGRAKVSTACSPTVCSRFVRKQARLPATFNTHRTMCMT